MINIEQAKNEFKKYLQQFQASDSHIQLKIDHTFRVIAVSKTIAESLGLSEEEVNLAQIIALLHDIGRFKQISQFQTCIDEKSMDHAEYGADILFQDEKKIRLFIDSHEYDTIIEKAVRNHSKFSLPKGLTKKEDQQAKIIRDADKLDNLYLKQFQNIDDIFKGSGQKELFTSEITPKVYEDFCQEKCIMVTDRKTPADFWVCILAFIFDLNFAISYQMVKENNYINHIIDRLTFKHKQTAEQIQEIRKIANDYLERKIKEVSR